MRKIALWLLIGLPLPLLAADYRLFHIKRNKNRNLVQYAIRLGPACQPRGKKPVYGYWRMLEKGPRATEEIGYFEEMAYGIRRQKFTGGGGSLRLKPLPEREIKLRIVREGGKCLVTALTRVNGKLQRLREVYVFAKENLVGLPSVRYVDLKAPGDRERINKD